MSDERELKEMKERCVRGARLLQSGIHLSELARLLKAGSIAAGYANEMWTLARISALVEARFNARFASSS